MNHRTAPAQLRAEMARNFTYADRGQNPAVAAARPGIRTGGRPVKPRGLSHVWIAVGLLVAGGGIAWAVTAARHVRRYSTALLKVEPPPAR